MTALAVGAIATTFFVAADAADASSPTLDLNAFATPSNLPADTQFDSGKNLPLYTLIVSNHGAAATSGPFTVHAEFPAGITPVSVAPSLIGLEMGPLSCQISGQAVTCIEPSAGLRPGWTFPISIGVDVGSFPDPTTVEAHFATSGGGSASTEITVPTVISAATAPFGFLPGVSGLAASVTDPDGDAVTEAGSHPYQLDVRLGFPSLASGDLGGGGFTTIPADGGARDVSTALPRGLVVDPQATPVRCTEAQLESGGKPGCPAASQVGLATVITNIISPAPVRNPVFNMVPPPGQAATLAFDAIGNGTYIHIAGGVRGRDYALAANSSDILARGGNPLFGVNVSLWGDPSAASHDGVRGICARELTQICTAPVTRQQSAFLTMPTSCSEALSFDAAADSWLHPGTFVSRTAVFSDGHGNPTGVSDCGQLEFNPSITLQPTSEAADSSSGMDVDLNVPQPDTLDTLAEAHLKRAVVTLPVGMALNPSAADGLKGCTEAQIGIINESPIQFDNSDPSCPNGSVVGSATVETPLLPDPLPGTLYVADPDDNPFHSLLSGYLVVKGQGVTLKIPGRFDRDPQTGQITAVFDNNPQLPFDDLQLHFKGGARGVLVTPPECGTYTIKTDLVPWSAADPDNPTPAEVVHRSNTFDITSGPDGGSCPSGDLRPKLNAGLANPVAASTSPFVLRLSREDGTQRFRALDVTMPPGLTAYLKGVPYCPDEALAGISGDIGSGRAQISSPGCPASSQIGTVSVGSGAGSRPLYVNTGKAYLAGPYRGAPLSIAIVTPAVAGPFDLGSVVVRSAVYVDPTTAQIRVSSDPIPTILHGIPLNVRDIRVNVDRPDFTLAPTSCEAMSVGAQVQGERDASTNVSSRFQLGDCASLGFAPKLALRLKGKAKRGGNPALTAVLTAKGGEANIARASVALPHSEFLDQAHIRTVCTRVQFNAGAGHGAQCPQGAVYGNAQATTPLLDHPLEGPVFLRSSSHELPDLVAALNGQIDVVLAGRIDSHKGGIRNTFDIVPDAPVSRFVLRMQGGKKGLLVNSTNICKGIHRATVSFTGHNGDVAKSSPQVKALKCPKKKRRSTHGKHRPGRK